MFIVCVIDQTHSQFTLIMSVFIITVSAQQTPDPGLSSGALAGIVGGVVLLVSAVLAAVVIYQCRTISKLRRGKHHQQFT